MTPAEIIDSGVKIITALTGLGTLGLVWFKALPKIEQIHVQTNSLAQKAEAGAHALGVQEGLKQAGIPDPAIAAAAALVLQVAADHAADLMKISAQGTASKTESNPS